MASIRRQLSPRFAIVASLATLLPSVVFGQTRTWDDYCTTGPFQACMSVQVSLVQVPAPNYFGGTGTAVTVLIQNLEGVLGSSGAWGLRGLQITGLASSGFADGENVGVVPILKGDAGIAGNARIPGSIWEAEPRSGGALISREAQLGDGGIPIAGCARITPDATYGLYFLEPSYFTTCGVDSWIAYTFITNPGIAFQDGSTITMMGNSDSGQGLSCTFGVDCQQVAVAPEPNATLLLGTGLVGIGGLRARRKRGGRIT